MVKAIEPGFMIGKERKFLQRVVHKVLGGYLEQSASGVVSTEGLRWSSKALFWRCLGDLRR